MNKEFWNAVNSWMDKELPLTNTEGALRKLKCEVKELEIEENGTNRLLEYADIIMCIIRAAEKEGIKYDTLVSACFYKLGVNKKRKFVYDKRKRNYSHLKLNS